MKLTYRPEIDGLRAIAVVSVILYHAQITIFGHQPFKGGFIGVDIFFVISGYLITSIILKELVTTGTFSFKYFYERRIRRILPVLLFVMLVSLTFAWIYFPPYELLNLSKSILYSLGFSSNFYFHYSGQEYAIAGLRNPFLHTWSLSIEEQYYILFPIVLLITFKYFRKYLIYILISGFIFSLGLAEWTSRNYPSISFYFLHTRIWELLIGSILAYFEITKGQRSQNKTLNLILPSIGLFLIVNSILFYNDQMVHPSLYTLSPIIGICLIIWFSQKNELITKILSTKLFVGIGLISYSLYLWHYPIFSFIAITNLTGGSKLIQAYIFIGIIFLSFFSYFYIERKARDKKTNLKKLSVILILKLLIIVIICSNIIKLEIHPIIKKHLNEVNYKINYNFNNFDNRKNIFIVGNSYADDLLNILSNNEKLNNQYYFYTAKSDLNNVSYQIRCLKEFLLKRKIYCEKNSFAFLTKQYEKSDFIIFAESFNRKTYLNSEFEEVIKILERDKKKFIIFLDDFMLAPLVLDNYLYKKQKIPSLYELNNLEKISFQEMINFKKRNSIEVIENKLLKMKIQYLTRSELFCDYVVKKCFLMKNNNKIYKDFGHITNFGANYFSEKGKLIMEKLENN